MQRRSITSTVVMWSRLTPQKQSLPVMNAKLSEYSPCIGARLSTTARGLITRSLYTPHPKVSTTTSLQRHRRTESTASYDNAIGQEKEKQTRAPWHREGASVPPVNRARAAGAMTKGTYRSGHCFLFSLIELRIKGKLLTTPSRLLKLVVPLTTLDKNSDRKDIEPLALLVHPQQPLSYLERLIQSELPSTKTEKGDEVIPRIYFRAQESQQDQIEPKSPGSKTDDSPEDMHEHADGEGGFGEANPKGQIGSRDTLNKGSEWEGSVSEQSLGEGKVESYSGAGHESSAKEGPRKFVRWSPSTEIGDFIRDAARGKEFAIEIEGAPNEIRVGVPSFNDRTHYLRLRLRKTANKIADLATVKKECDMAAHKSAQRVAVAGAGLLVGYWYAVYRLTFETELGWGEYYPPVGPLLFLLTRLRCHGTRNGESLSISMFLRLIGSLVPGRPFYPNLWLSLVSLP